MKWLWFPITLILFSCSTSIPAQSNASVTPFICPISPYTSGLPPDPNTASFTPAWFGNKFLWAGLDRAYQGKWYAGGAKVLWYRVSTGQLTIQGSRIDQPGQPLTADIPDGYGDRGIQATSIDFPSEGCWKVIGNIDNEQLVFTVEVLPSSDNPIK